MQRTTIYEQSWFAEVELAPVDCSSGVFLGESIFVGGLRGWDCIASPAGVDAGHKFNITFEHKSGLWQALSRRSSGAPSLFYEGLARVLGRVATSTYM